LAESIEQLVQGINKWDATSSARHAYSLPRKDVILLARTVEMDTEASFAQLLGVFMRGKRFFFKCNNGVESSTIIDPTLTLSPAAQPTSHHFEELGNAHIICRPDPDQLKTCTLPTPSPPHISTQTIVRAFRSVQRPPIHVGPFQRSHCCIAHTRKPARRNEWSPFIHISSPQPLCIVITALSHQPSYPPDVAQDHSCPNCRSRWPKETCIIPVDSPSDHHHKPTSPAIHSPPPYSFEFCRTRLR
jgi:hypothetical protein